VAFFPPKKGVRVMPRKKPPEPPKIDWREFVDEMRAKRLHREFNRPSDLLGRHSVKWTKGPPGPPTWLGGPWPWRDD